MGDSLPPPAGFDLIGSYARRRGSDVEIVLTEPKSEVTGSSVVVSLAKGKKSVEATGALQEDSGGRRLTVRAPRASLTDGNWTLTLRGENGSPEPLAARLLVQGDRPLVLLWGAKDKATLLPTARRGATSSKRRAAAAAGRALDRALSVLPDDQAKKVRAGARTTARRVLG